MFDIVVRRGDTLPRIEKTVYSNGEPVDLTGGSVKFVVSSLDGSEIINRDAMIDSDAVGRVVYQWTSDDSTEVTDDIVFVRFVVTIDADTFTVPNNRPLSMMITNITSHEFSYSGDPSARPLDRVRFHLQDTNLDTPMFTDSELLHLLEENSNTYYAAAEAAEMQATRFSNARDKTVGPLSIKFGEQVNRWIDVATRLRKRARQGGAGGAILTQKRRDPYFTLGMHDNGISNVSNTDPDALLGMEPQ